MVVEVKGSLLATAFSGAALVLKSSKIAASIRISYENYNLTFAVDSQMQYLYSMPVDTVDTNTPMSINIKFFDISEFIKSKDTVSLDISPVQVSVEVSGYTFRLPISESIIVPYKATGTIDSVLDLINVRKLIQLGRVGRALKLDRPILFTDSYAYLKYPTLWARVKASGILGSIPMDLVNLLLNFSPKSVSRGKLLEFKSNSQLIAVPVTPFTPDKEFEEFVKASTLLTTINAGSVSSIVSLIHKTIGDSSVDLHIGSTGFAISAHAGNVSINKVVGNVDSVIFSCSVPLEFFNACIQVFDAANVEIRRNNKLLLFCTSAMSVIISTI